MLYFADRFGRRLSRGSLLPMLWILLITTSCPLRSQEVPFHRGVNLTGWFQVSGAGQIQFTRYTKTDFEQIKSLGCDVIRLPINLHYMTYGSPDYTIEPLFYEFLDEVVSWAEELEIHLILDNHTFDVTSNTDPDIGPVLEKVWTQMAAHYKDATEFLYYEVLNEPHGISDNLWNTIQQQVIEAIREVDTKHFIVIGPAGWNSYNNLDDMPVYTDSKLIYTFHFYDPFVFTHQGASWVDPSMVPLSGVPFPYHPDSMPAFPSSLNGTWIQQNFNDYQNLGTAARVKSWLDIAILFKNGRNVPVYCGEFGVYIPNSNNYSRNNWYGIVRKYLEENGIAWTAWDYHGGFGLFEEDGNGMFDHDLNVPLLDSLGLVIPEQTVYVQKADSVGFMLYSDYIGNRIFESGYGSHVLSFYSTGKPNNDKYCLSWSGAAQYNTVGFDFQPDRDLSRLVSEGYALDLMLRGSSSSISFDIRFMDTKTSDPADHPWRMRYTFNGTNSTFDGRWHHIHIPLSSFTEQGSWDNNTWYNPEGKFDWKAIDRVEIVSEQQSLSGKDLWFDNIHIANLDTARVFEESFFSHSTDFANPIRDIRIYPNPAHDFIYISSRTNNLLYARIIDNTGRTRMEIRIFAETDLNISDLPSGIYFLHIVESDRLIAVNKLVKL